MPRLSGQAWIVDEGKADADEVEVAVDARLQAHRLFLQGDIGREPHDEMSSVERHRPEGVCRDLPTDRVEREVDATPVRDVVHVSDEVLRTVVDGMVRPELAAELDLLVGSRGRDDHGTEGLGELDHPRTHTARCGVDEDDLTGLQPPTLAQSEPSRR